MEQIKLVQINTVNFGSTGTIMLSLGKITSQEGYKIYYAFPKISQNRKRLVSDTIFIGTRFDYYLHRILGYFTGLNGCYSIFATFRFLKKISEIKPSIIHLHNLHNCFINLPLLFRYLKKQHIPVIWTLHDCWSFTGQCPYFSAIGCEKWKTGCHDCPQYMNYPKSKVDQTKLMYKMKKKWFTGIEECTLVTPSQWLADCVSESFLRDYPVKVIQNGIDLDIFRPVESSFRIKHSIQNKYIILGVSFGWSLRKGLNIFIDLCQFLPEDFQIVLVGVSEEDRKVLPKNCIALGLTSNAYELAEIYSSVDIFLNPSKEETMGLVTVEALACGTPVIVSNLTAVPEVVSPVCGIVVEDYSSHAFASVLLKKPRFTKKDCIARAHQFEKYMKYREYLDLYNYYILSEGK